MRSPHMIGLADVQVTPDNAAPLTRLRAHIHSLPPELLLTIFSYTLPKEPSFEPNTSPLLISHVCSLWRRLALGTPLLWSQLSIRFPCNGNKKDNDDGSSSACGDYARGPAMSLRVVYTFVDLWLERSKPGLVDIETHLPLSDKEEDISAHAILATILSPHCHRIRSLYGRCMKAFIFNLPLSKMMSLEVLDLYVHPSGSFPRASPDLSSCINLILGLPRLHSLDLTGLQHDVPPIAPSLPTNARHQLSCLKLKVPAPSAACDLMLALPDLKEVDFWIGESHIQSAIPKRRSSMRIPLPQLRSLTINAEMSTSDPCLIFNSFAAPELQVLHLRFPKEFIGTWDALRNFIHASSPCKLQTLKLDGHSWPAEPEVYLLDILHLVHELHTLEIRGMKINATILRALIWREGDESAQLVPHLRKLWVIDVGHLDHRDLAAMLRSRPKLLDFV